MNALLLVALVAPGQTKPPAVAARGPLTAELAKWVQTERGKKTQEQVIARLGPPDSYQHADLTANLRYIADVQLLWKDEATVDVQIKDRKVVGWSARYSGFSPRPQLAPENVLRLKVGMTDRDVDKLLGSRFNGRQARATVQVAIQAGKNAGYGVFGGFHDAKKAANLRGVSRPVFDKGLAAALGKEKTAADVMQKLGRPERIDHPHDGSRGPKGATVLAWDQATEIEATFKDGKTVRLVGRFAAQLPQEKITPANFTQLNHGTTLGGGKTPPQLAALLGPPREEVKEKDGLIVRRYGARRLVEVFVDADGKVLAARFESQPKK